MQISVIIPMYNENKIIADTARQLSEYMAETFESYEILFSDDGSADGCGDTVDALGLPFVRVIRYKENQGKGAAVRRGMLEAQGDLVLFTDADLAYGVEVIHKFYQAFIEGGKDIYIGSRTLDKSGYEGYTLKRKIMSKVYIKYLNIVAGFDHSDSQCGIKCFSREATGKIFSLCECDRWAFDLEALLIAKDLGLSVGEIPVKIINHRESKISPIRDAIQMTKEVSRIKKRRKARRNNTV